MKIFFKLFILLLFFYSCNKNKSTNPTQSTNNSQGNYYSFKIGSTNFSTSSIYGQPFNTTPDTLLFVNFGSVQDTMSGGFTLKVNGLGTFTHDSLTVNETNRFVINMGDYSNPHSTFFSKSGTIHITQYDFLHSTYAGTFSAVMALSTNPSYTLPLTNGAFYLKY